MAGRFSGTIVIDRPIDEVFDFVADGENDRRFSKRVLEIAKTTEGPIGVGTIYASSVRDGSVKTRREFELTEFVPPTRIRWTERSSNPVVVPEGGYDLAPLGDGQTRLTLFNHLEGRGIGKLIAPIALRSARRAAPSMVASIKQEIESQ